MARFYVYTLTSSANPFVNTLATFSGATLKRRGTDFTTAGFYITADSLDAVPAKITTLWNAATPTAAWNIPAHSPTINFYYRLYGRLAGALNSSWISKFTSKRLIAKGQVIGAASTQPKVAAYFGRPGQFLGWYDDQGRVW